MKRKSLIALVMLSTLVLSFSMQSFADRTVSSSSAKSIKKSTASSNSKHVAEDIPSISSEAEYAEFVRRREGAGQTSSVKSTRSIQSLRQIESTVANSASSNSSKIPSM